MKQYRNYYILEKPPRTLGSQLLSLLKVPFLLPQWILSFLISRNFTNATLNPNKVKAQKSTHLVFVSNDKTENGTVIINILPPEPYKGLNDYLLTVHNTIIKLPFMAAILRRSLSYKNHKDKAHVDAIINEIDLLMQGRSTSEKCDGKKFAIDELHLKGLDGLDDDLYSYFKKQVRQKFGTDFIEQPRKINLEFYTLQTQDRSVLDSVAVSSVEEASKPYSERTCVIACMARNQNYVNWIKDFNYSAQQIGCTVIGFNYRGIDYSKGMVWTQDNMVNDALAQVQRLLNLGVKPENIGLEGMSLGGAIATLAAAKLHEKDLQVSLYNERSFRSIPRLVSGYVLPDAKSNPWNPINWCRYLVAGIVYVGLVCTIWIIGWNVDAAKAWNKIPERFKNFSIARNHLGATPQEHEDDGIIHDSWASIGSLIDEHKEELKQKKALNKTLTAEEETILADQSESHEFKLPPNPENKVNSPHHAPRRYLMNTHNERQLLHDHMITSFRTQLGQTSFYAKKEPKPYRLETETQRRSETLCNRTN